MGKALSASSSDEVDDVDEVVERPEADVPPKATSETQAEKPMPEMPNFTKASQAEPEPETEAAEIPVADHVISIPSPNPQNEDDLPISPIFKNKADDEEDDDDIVDEEIEAEEMPKSKLPSLKTIINDAIMAGALTDDVERIKVTFGRALSLGVSMDEMMEIEEQEKEVRLAEEQDAASRRLAKSLALQERDDLTSEGEKTKLDPYQAQQHAYELAKKASQEQQAEAERQRIQREAEAT